MSIDKYEADTLSSYSFFSALFPGIPRQKHQGVNASTASASSSPSPRDALLYSPWNDCWIAVALTERGPQLIASELYSTLTRKHRHNVGYGGRYIGRRSRPTAFVGSECYFALSEGGVAQGSMIGYF
ncbi:hypothetical protein LTR37_020572 [Vermiconidia calcicola]|uniref:Uncharacterized protein n=1 Tax=Vermiconidia calcicola TaxID=1690605 RepID=A0ACC3MCD7_9PEZI|nr:hypothetical protein LTR37_020572 [Vermiconidia calcicola]